MRRADGAKVARLTLGELSACLVLAAPRGAAPAAGQPGQERGGPSVAADVPGLPCPVAQAAEAHSRPGVGSPAQGQARAAVSPRTAPRGGLHRFLKRCEIVKWWGLRRNASLVFTRFAATAIPRLPGHHGYLPGARRPHVPVAGVADGRSCEHARSLAGSPARPLRCMGPHLFFVFSAPRCTAEGMV